MCGIVGIWKGRWDNKPAWNSIKVALERMLHRGPDDWGVELINTKDGCAFDLRKGNPGTADIEGFPLLLGHRRLSVIDLSKKGRQPMFSRDGRKCIVYNGEVYNFGQIRNELKTRGHEFRTGTDTEVILASYDEWGTDCLRHFNGMWAFALYDAERRILFCARDRFGIKPFVYSWADDSYFFASEIPALLSFSDVKRTASDEAVYRYLVYGLIPFGGETFLESIHELQAGHYLIIDESGSHQIERWWHISPEKGIAKRDVISLWRETFLEAVELRLVSDVPLGSCLSGGLDSSCVVGALQRAFSLKGKEDRIQTFTSAYEERECNETEYADLMNAHVSSAGHVIEPLRDCDVESDIEHLITAQGEPFPNLSIYSQYCVMRLARRHGVTVLLDGQGADEVLGGYPFCQIAFLKSLLARRKIPKFLSTWAAMQLNNDGLGFPKILLGLMYFGNPKVIGFRKRLEAKRFVRRDLLGCGYDREAERWSRHSSFHEMRVKWIEEAPLPALLRYEDRNSMAFSVETRLPFLDYRLVNLAFGLGDDELVHDGWSKYVLRKSMEGLIPELIRWRKSKLGFAAPTGVFLSQLYPRICEAFAETASRCEKYVDMGALRCELRKGNVSDILWRIFNLEIWMKLFEIH